MRSYSEWGVRNPHFDDNIVVWNDRYSGRYLPPPAGYSSQFDLQWWLTAAGTPGYSDRTGGSTHDDFIADRVYEWTGKHPHGGHAFRFSPSGSRVLDHPINPEHIRGKECIDVACGLGRWTRTMLSIGARSVTAIDMSASALKNVGRYTNVTRQVNVMHLREEHPDLLARFDFANFWGVAMCTHDPQQAFLNAAATVKPGGYLYLMVYSPNSLHGMAEVNRRRRHFHQLPTLEERLAYVDLVVDRRWDPACSLKENAKNRVKNALRRPHWDKLNTLDMLEPFYNFVVPLDTIYGWYAKAGFSRPEYLNEYEPAKIRSAYHMLGQKKLV